MADDKNKRKVKVVKRYVCVKQCFDGKRLIMPNTKEYFTKRMIPDSIMSNFKEIEVTEVYE